LLKSPEWLIENDLVEEVSHGFISFFRGCSSPTTPAKGLAQAQERKERMAEVGARLLESEMTQVGLPPL
jgi:hypothetical protein